MLTLFVGSNSMGSRPRCVEVFSKKAGPTLTPRERLVATFLRYNEMVPQIDHVIALGGTALFLSNRQVLLVADESLTPEELNQVIGKMNKAHRAHGIQRFALGPHYHAPEGTALAILEASMERGDDIEPGRLRAIFRTPINVYAVNGVKRMLRILEPTLAEDFDNLPPHFQFPSQVDEMAKLIQGALNSPAVKAAALTYRQGIKANQQNEGLSDTKRRILNRQLAHPLEVALFKEIINLLMVEDSPFEPHFIELYAYFEWAVKLTPRDVMETREYFGVTQALDDYEQSLR